MWKFLLISLALIQAIECRTNQDVINDFELVFQERHNELTELQNSTTNQILPKIEELNDEIVNQTKTIIEDLLPVSVNRIIENITEYIKILGLDQSPDLTKSCTDNLTNALEVSQHLIMGEERACSLLLTGKSAIIYPENYTDIIKNLENEHLALNETREKCIELETPFEVQTCLINDLYTFFIPHIKNVTDNTQQIIDEWSNEIIRIQNEDVTPCFELIQNDITMFEQRIIDDAKVCLWFIQKPKV